MQYPADFPDEYQASVEREKILANQEFIEGRRRLTRMSPDRDVLNLILKYIIRVVLEFAKKACALGMSRAWTAPQIDHEVHEFIEQVTAEAHNEKRFDSAGDRISKMALVDYSSRRVLPELVNSFKSTKEWASYQQGLLKVSEFQANPFASSIVPPPDPRLEPKPIDFHLLKNRSDEAIQIEKLLDESALTQPELAAKMRIPASTVFRHIKGEMIPGKRILGEYQQVFSKLLKRNVVITRSAIKRN